MSKQVLTAELKIARSRWNEVRKDGTTQERCKAALRVEQLKAALKTAR